MKPAPPAKQVHRTCRWFVLLAGPVFFLQPILAASSDYFFDEGQRDPKAAELRPNAERQAEAMARFVTGIFEEETSGPEQAMENFRRVLEVDPGFSKLAIDVAHDYLRRGDSTEAIGVLKDALKAKPKDIELSLALASIYLRHLRKPDLAARYAEKAASSAPNAMGGYEALWEIALAQGNLTEANRALDRALKSKTQDPEFWLKLAELYATSTSADAFADEKLAQKLTLCLTRASESEAQDPALLARIGDFYALNRQFESATAIYQRVAGIKPGLPNLNEKLAEMLIQLGRFDEAAPVLEAIIAKNPLDIRAYDSLANIYTERGEYQKAVAALEQSIIIDKSYSDRYRELAKLLLVAGQPDRACARLEEARKLFPQAPVFTHLYARALSLAKRHDEALKMFDRARLESSVTQPEVIDGSFFLDYGMAAESAGNPVKAAELFKKSIEVDPANAALALNALGYMWADRNENLDEAETLIRRALEFDPNNGAYIDSLGWVLFRKGRFEDALAELLRASNVLEQPDAVVYDHIGDAYQALKRESEALLYWQKSLQLDDKNASVMQKIDQLSSQLAKKPTPSPTDPQP